MKNMTITHQDKNLDILSKKINSLKIKDIDDELRFELEFVLYRLNNIHSSKEIKDINPDKLYKFKKLALYKKINHLDGYLTSLITNEEIIEISKLKISDFEEHYKKNFTNKK